MRFRLKYPKAPLPPNEFTAPSQASISLVFFAAYLFELDSIKAFGTIRNYMSQVMQFYVKNVLLETLMIIAMKVERLNRT